MAQVHSGKDFCEFRIHMSGTSGGPTGQFRLLPPYPWRSVDWSSESTCFLYSACDKILLSCSLCLDLQLFKFGRFICSIAQNVCKDQGYNLLAYSDIFRHLVNWLKNLGVVGRTTSGLSQEGPWLPLSLDSLSSHPCSRNYSPEKSSNILRGWGKGNPPSHWSLPSPPACTPVEFSLDVTLVLLILQRLIRSRWCELEFQPLRFSYSMV
jgi:hypothetical protein